MALESLTKLLKKHNVGISAVKTNKILLANGLLEERLRPSSRDPSVMKKFKVLTEAGLEFGENVANDLSPNETTPKYDSDKFADLVSTHLR